MAASDAQAALREAMEAGEVLQAQLAQLDEQMSYLSAITQEFQRARATLEALAMAKKGDELLLPLGGGAYVRATLAEEDSILSGIGAGVHVHGPVSDALRRVDEQLAAAREANERLQQDMQRVLQQMQAVEARVGELAG